MTQTFNLPRQTPVGITQVTLKDLKLMKPKQVYKFARLAIQELASKKISIRHSGTSARVPLKSTVGENRLIGAKVGVTSKYHYVWFNAESKQYFCGITVKGEKIMIGYYADEKDAAKAVDEFLDKMDDTRRPRNRTEFPELLEPEENNDDTTRTY